MQENDTIVCKKIFIDITQNLVSGILLCSILRYYTEDREFESEKADFLWIVRTPYEWYTDCRLDIDELNLAIGMLMRQELIVNKIFKHEGSYRRHIRLNMGMFLQRLKEAEVETNTLTRIFEGD